MDRIRHMATRTITVPDSTPSTARSVSAAKARYQELAESSAPLRNRVIDVHDWASKRALWAADDEMAVLREQIARAGTNADRNSYAASTSLWSAPVTTPADRITGEELLHQIKMRIWNAMGGEHPSDFTFSELADACRQASEAFTATTGREYDNWSSAQTYPSTVVQSALKAVAA